MIWNESDREWRADLWRHMLDMLPVEVLVNLAGRGFSMRGRGGVSIYADDIDEAEYVRMIDEWSALLGGGAELRWELRPEALDRRFAIGEREFGFRLPMEPGMLAVRVRFRGAPEEEPFVIRLERAAREKSTANQ